MEIYKRMADASKQIKAIAKDDVNRAQNFKFRGIDAIYNGVHEALAANGIFCVPKVIRVVKEKEVATAKGGQGIHLVLEMEYTFFAGDGSFVTATTWGEGIDYGDKCVNKCMSIAHKYALLQIFTIPTDDSIDPDAMSYEVVKYEVGPGLCKTASLTQQRPIAPEKIDRIDEMCRKFAEDSVTPREIEIFLKKPLDSMIEQDFTNLRSIYAEMKSGSGKPFSAIVAARESAKSKIENM
jgi:hypothetical protein